MIHTKSNASKYRYEQRRDTSQRLRRRSREGSIATNPDQTDAVAAHEEREWLRVTLSCIGDAVITTDSSGNITLLNPVAQSLTGWTQDEAFGVPLGTAFAIIQEENRQPVESPTVRAMREGVVVGLSDHTLFLARDGSERAIDHSATPIRNAAGDVYPCDSESA